MTRAEKVVIRVAVTMTALLILPYVFVTTLVREFWRAFGTAWREVLIEVDGLRQVWRETRGL